jgi:hypothetical protein
MTSGDELFRARGVTHSLLLLESDGRPGTAILYVTSFSGSGSATISAQERLDLAKALYPEAFEGRDDLTARSFEYGIFDGEDQVVDTTWRTPMLAALTKSERQTIKKRVVAGPWMDVEKDEVRW